MKNIWTRIYPHTQRRQFFVALFSAAALMFIVSPIVYLQSQSKEGKPEQDKILEKGKDFNPPVNITLIKSHIGVIEPGQKLSADDDWFKGLAISVRNDSEEPITHISLNILFPRPPGQENELGFVERVDYGESPVPFADGRVPFNAAKPIMPGDSVELKLSDEDYYALRTSLRESKYSSSIKKIKVDVSMLGFNDGTVWMGGERYELDKNSPGKLILLKKKSM